MSVPDAMSHQPGANGDVRPVPMFVSVKTAKFGPSPTATECPHCQRYIVTHIDRVSGFFAWLVFAVCAVLGFFCLAIPWCFCVAPFCIDSYLDVIHSCPACRAHLGRYKAST